MTLNTLVGFEEYTDPQEFHAWINRELLNAPDATCTAYGPEGERLFGDTYWHQNTVANLPGQGLDAWAITHHNNGEVILDINYGGEDDPDLRVYTALDTAYGYRSEIGGCADLHKNYIRRIIGEYAASRNLTVWWHNEFTGEWHLGTEGLVDFR